MERIHTKLNQIDSKQLNEKQKFELAWKISLSQFFMTNLIMLCGSKLLVLKHWGRINLPIKLAIFSGLYVATEPLIIFSSVTPLLISELMGSEN